MVDFSGLCNTEQRTWEPSNPFLSPVVFSVGRKSEPSRASAQAPLKLQLRSRGCGEAAVSSGLGDPL